MAGSRSLRLALLLPLGALLDATLVQAEGRFVAPEAGAALESGATVRVAWSLAETRACEAEEMELVLSLDGGETFFIRVTRDLSPQRRSFSWRVPLLPTDHARLALRTGEGGNERIELVSDEFAIAAVAAAPLELTMQVAGEWRTEEALDGDSERPLSLPASLAGAPSTIASDRQIPPVDAPRPPLAALESPFRDSGVKASTTPAAKPLLPTLPRTPASAPMRA